MAKRARMTEMEQLLTGRLENCRDDPVDQGVHDVVSI
jgi:hypothetical protein